MGNGKIEGALTTTGDTTVQKDLKVGGSILPETGPTLTLGGNVSITGNLTVGGNSSGPLFDTSDLRLKEKIMPLTSSLQEILQLKPVRLVEKVGFQFMILRKILCQCQILDLYRWII